MPTPKASEVPMRVKGPHTPQTLIASFEVFKPHHDLQGKINNYSSIANYLNNEQLIEEIIKAKNQKRKASWMKQELLYRVLPVIISAVSHYFKSLVLKTGKEIPKERQTDYYNDAIKAILEAIENRTKGTCVLGNHREYTFEKINNIVAFVYKTAKYSCLSTCKKSSDIQIKSETKEYFSYVNYENEELQPLIEYSYIANTLDNECVDQYEDKPQSEAEELLCFAMDSSNKILSERQATALKKKFWDNDSSNTRYKNSEAMARAEGIKNLKKFFMKKIVDEGQHIVTAV